MHEDTIADWQRLTQLYSEMDDGELEALNADIGDLTEVAQQVLRDEMKKRGLNDSSVPRGAFEPREHFAPLQEGPEVDSLTEEDDTEDGGLPHEYTWKTLLCECEEREEAWQIREVLRQAGIESWIEGQGSRVWDAWAILEYWLPPTSLNKRERSPHGRFRRQSSSNPGCKSRITSLLCVPVAAPRTLFSRRRSCEFVALREMREAVDRSDRRSERLSGAARLTANGGS